MMMKGIEDGCASAMVQSLVCRDRHHQLRSRQIKHMPPQIPAQALSKIFNPPQKAWNESAPAPSAVDESPMQLTPSRDRARMLDTGLHRHDEQGVI